MAEYLVEIDVSLPTEDDPFGEEVVRLRRNLPATTNIYDLFAEMAVEVDKSINEKGREQEYELATDSIDN
jgi:hypothetical protein